MKRLSGKAGRMIVMAAGVAGLAWTGVGCRATEAGRASSVPSEGVAFVGLQVAEDFSRFGGSGYYVLAPDADVAGVPAGGGPLTAHGTLAQRPAFLAADPEVLPGMNWVNYTNYATVIPPGGDAPLRLGGLSGRMADSAAIEGLATIGAPFVSFTLETDALFRLGVLVDAFDGFGAYAPDFVGVHDGASGRTVYSADVLRRDGDPDLVLFDIAGRAGVTYTVSLHRAASAEGVPLTGLSALSFDRHAPGAAVPGVESTCAAVGYFQRAGEYMKDYYVFKDGDTYHLFYNVGDAGPEQCWTQPRNEKAFGHATSQDLRNWTHHSRILEVVPGTWEGEVVSAPSVLKHDGLYYMIYTGFDDRWRGMQTIGLATSEDLFHWERHPDNPLYRAPDWAHTNPNGWENCRDAHIMRYGDEFLMYTMVQMPDGRGAISLAGSPDAVHWEDLGPALITFREPESPRVFEYNGTYYMFASSGHGRVLYKTQTPKSDQWEPVPFNWPANKPGTAMGQQWAGIWSGWEVVEFEDDLVFSAFYWKPHGGFIKFWDVEWDGDVPTVIYEKDPA